MKWTEDHVRKLKQSGKIRDYTIIGGNQTPEVKKILKQAKPEPKGLSYIKSVLDQNNIPYCTEYRFHDVRKFRFDVALPMLKLAFEYEGVMSEKSRHTSVTGYTRDATKYNLAQQLGWNVHRYTTLNYKQFESDLKEILK